MWWLLAIPIILAMQEEDRQNESENKDVDEYVAPFSHRYTPGIPYNNTMNLKHDEPIKRKK